MANLVGNLVDNAIEYTQRGGRITLRCRREDGWVRLEVEDNGPGIPAEERRRVFERFHRSPGTPGAGSGLGLAIVSEIAQAHDATVEIAQPATGTGTLVIVRIPAVEEAGIERRAASELHHADPGPMIYPIFVLNLKLERGYGGIATPARLRRGA